MLNRKEPGDVHEILTFLVGPRAAIGAKTRRVPRTQFNFLILLIGHASSNYEQHCNLSKELTYNER